MAHSHDHGSNGQVPRGHGSHGHGSQGHSHGHGSHDHAGTADKTRVLTAAALTGGFMVVEAIGGVLTGSLALLADAGHMLADSVALGLSWYAFHLASRPSTVRLTYGFHRFKTLAAYTNGLTIFLIALWIVYEAILRFMAPPPVLAGPMLAVACGGLAVNVIAFFVLRGGDHGDLNMRGAILHVLGDLLGSAAAIVAALVILATGWVPIDPILSVLVALLILSTAASLIRHAAHVLLEGAPSPLDRDTLAADIETHVAGVGGVHHVHVWSLDGSRTMATLHARIEGAADPDRTVAAIKQRLAQSHGIGHATVELEHAACADTVAHGHQ